MKYPSILEDPRYKEYRARYINDWPRLTLNLTGTKPTWQQMPIIRGVSEIKCRYSISSGHGTGKSHIIAVLILAFITLYPKSRVVLVANKVMQVKTGVYKYLKIHWAEIQKRDPWLAQYFVLTDSAFYAKGYKGVWEVLAKGYRLGQEESLAGEHAEHLMYIIDEASAIGDKAFGVMQGALTQGDNRMVLISQPTRNTGTFYETHHGLKRKNPTDKTGWNSITLNSEHSPLVTKDWVLEQLRKYGNNRDNPQYLIKVRGEFADSLDGMLIGSKAALKAVTANVRLHKDWGWVATADVGNGRDSCVLSIFRVSGYRETLRAIPYKVIELGGEYDSASFATKIIGELKSGSYPNIQVGIDADGVGKTTARLCEDAGLAVTRIRWGFPCFSTEDKGDYVNQRAYASAMLRDMVLQGRIKLDANPKTREQMQKLPYMINEKGQLQIMSKAVMKAKLNIDSPDRADTYCFLALVPVVPAGNRLTGSQAKDMQEAEAFLN